MFALILALLVSPAVADKQSRDTMRIQALLQRNLGTQAINPKLLAPAIYRVAREYNVSQDLLTRIIIVESRGIEHAVNNKSNDYGIMQIHITDGNVEKMHCAMHWQCALEMAARILSTARRACAYNTGNVGSFKYPKTCINYERRLASVQ